MPPEDCRQRWSGYWAYVGLNALALAVSAPFALCAELSWSTIRLLLLTGAVSVVLADLWYLTINFSWRNALAFAALASGLGWLAEFTGIRWGIPFGVRYDYHPAMWPMLPGDVPLFIALAWFTFAQGPLVVFRRWSVVDAQGTLRVGRLLGKAAVCAALLVLYDMTLEPLALHFGLWKWAHAGSYFGTPYSNFRGWFVVGLTLYTSYFWTEARSGRRGRFWPLVDATWSVVALAFLSLVALALCKQIGGLLPTAVTGALIGIHAYAWYANREHSPTTHPDGCSTRSAAAR